MRAAEIGDRVRIHFTGRLRDGTVVASSYRDEPVEFTLGRHEVMPGLDDLVQGMVLGERRTADLPPHLAHGRHRNDLLLAVELDRFPSHVDPYAGQELVMKREGKSPTTVRVIATTGDMVVVDTNHPLAGKDLSIEVELLDFVEESTVVC